MLVGLVWRCDFPQDGDAGPVEDFPLLLYARTHTRVGVSALLSAPSVARRRCLGFPDNVKKVSGVFFSFGKRFR